MECELNSGKAFRYYEERVIFKFSLAHAEFIRPLILSTFYHYWWHTPTIL